MSNLSRTLAPIAHALARETWYHQNARALSLPRPAEGPRRLLIDVSMIARKDAQTGIQRVVRAVSEELRKRSNDDFELCPVHASPLHGYCLAPVDFLERRPRDLSRRPVSVRSGDKFLGLDLAAHILPKHVRQLRLWRAQGVTVHLIVYDLLPILSPHWFNSTAVGHFRKWLDIIAREADQAICISDDVARTLKQQLATQGRLPEIGRLQMGGDIAASRPSSGVCPELAKLLASARRRPFVLMVGTLEPRKGYDAALPAFEHIWRSQPEEAPDLIIVGKGGWKTTALQERIRLHPEFGKRLFWFERVSDEGLCRFYEACQGVLMASRGEGFGLPLIEAAMCHRYALVRNLPVFREKRLPNLLFFTDDRPEPLAHRVMDLVRASWHGPAPVADLPTWSDCVDGLLHEIGLTADGRDATRTLRKAS